MFTSRNGDRSGKKNVAVLITDGRSNNQAVSKTKFHITLTSNHSI